MILLYRENDKKYVWTKENDRREAMSPEFDEQHDALAWRGDVSFEIHREYSMIVAGKRLPIPVDRNHAYELIKNSLKYLHKWDGFDSKESQ